MSKFICPYCYETHRLNECGLKCSFNIPGTQKTCKHGISKDADGWIPDEQKAKCMKCTDAKKQIYCANVGKEIPTGFLSEQNLPIALIGAKYSGKSNYIAVLINEIRKKMIIPFNCSLDISCSEESLRNYDESYYTPVYKKYEIADGTDKGKVIPMIFPLKFMDSKNRIKKVATLTFYDTAGENLDSADDVLVKNRYIPNSRGIILLLDPLQVPSIRRELQGKMDNLPDVYTDVAEILNRVIQAIREVKNIKQKINIPLALAFTKLDALEKFGIIPPGSCLRDESEHLSRGKFVISDFENTNIEMCSILENWLDDELLQMMRQFSKYSLFGLSALGDIPDGDKLRGGEAPHPKRVLDPLLWILAENGFISKVKE